LLKLNNFQRVGGCHERLAQKLVRIQRDRRDEGIELIGWQFCGRLVLGSRGLILSQRKWRLHNQEQGANDGNQTSHESDVEWNPSEHPLHKSHLTRSLGLLGDDLLRNIG
jgi:hypothetical protein